MFKKFITFVSFLALVVSIAAQQPQNTLAPIVAENAKYANGVAPGYAPTSGTGLNVNISSGTANCGGTMVTFTGAAESLVANAVNYVYLNTTASCAVSVKTTSFVATDIPVASVTTSSSGIVATCNNNGTASPSGSYPCIIDYRTIFNVPGSGVGSPLTTKGDIYGFNTTNARIPVGADGTVLTAASAQPLGIQWQSIVNNLNAVTGPVTLVGDASITVTPVGQNIDLHATGSGGSGVQYLPSTTVHVVLSSSLLMDDNHVLGPTIASTATTCASGTCTVAASNTLAVGDWITAAYTTGWPAITSGIYGDGYSEFQVASATSSQFTFAYSGTVSLGAVNYYGANYWPMKQAAKLPYFNGHGTITRLDLGGTCANFVTNYTAYVHPLLTTGAGPHYLYVNDCHNDFAGSATAATVEGYIQTLAADAHTDGAIFVMATPWSQSFASPTISQQQDAFFQWIQGFRKSPTSTTSGQYADMILPMNDVLNNYTNASYFYNGLGELNYGGAVTVASQYNNLLATQGTYQVGDKPYFNYSQSQNGTDGGLTYHALSDSSGAFCLLTSTYALGLCFDSVNNVITTQNGIISSTGAAPFRVSTTANAGVYFEQSTAPNLAAGWNGNNPDTALKVFGVCNSTNGNCIQENFGYNASGGALNEYDLGFQQYGQFAPFTFLKALYNGGTPLVFFPSVAGASTYCLQIASNGQITNTGAGCGSGGGVADTTVSVTTATQTANSCSTTTNVTMTGLTTSMVMHTGYSANPATLTGWGSTGGMVFQIWPSAANTATWQVCNQTATSITYSAITFNVGAS